MRRHWAVPGTLLAVALSVLFIVWLITRGHLQGPDLEPTEGPPETSLPTDAAGSDRRNDPVRREIVPEPDDSRPLAAREPGALERRVLVRSSAGLPLQRVEILEGAHGPAEWPLDGGYLTLPAEREALDLRAPGHLAGHLDTTANEVTLEADALFEIVGERARERIREIKDLTGVWHEAAWEAGDSSWGIWGFAADPAGEFGASERWAMAVDIDAYLLHRTAGAELFLTLVLTGFQEIQLDLRLNRGLRARYELPPASDVATAPLRVLFEVAPSPFSEPHRFTCRLFTSSPERDEGSSVLTRYPWGSAGLYELESDTSCVVEQDTALFEAVPLSSDCHLLARSETTGDYGRLKFVHDGSSRLIRLARGLVVSGTLLAPPGLSDPPDAELSLSRHWTDRPADRWIWFASFAGVRAGEAFHLVAPDGIPFVRERPENPGEKLTVEIRAAGCRDKRVSVALGEGALCDLGEIHLERERPPLVLAPGHLLTPPDVHYTEVRVSEAGGCRSFQIVDGRPSESGALELYLEPPLDGPRETADGKVLYHSRRWPQETREGAAWPEPPPDVLLIDVNDRSEMSEARIFRRSANDSYRPEPMRRYDLRVALSAAREPDTTLQVGWTWRGLPVALQRFPPDFAGEAVLTFEAPSTETLLWWRAIRKGPRFESEEEYSAIRNLPLPATSTVVTIP
ncbi:MAG: hypothetical protein AB1486_10595 [Planctomycetota bacterium]